MRYKTDRLQGILFNTSSLKVEPVLLRSKAHVRALQADTQAVVSPQFLLKAPTEKIRAEGVKRVSRHHKANGTKINWLDADRVTEAYDRLRKKF